jgi:hypothetical protein
MVLWFELSSGSGFAFPGGGKQSAGTVYSRTVALPPPVPSPHVARHSNRLLTTKASSTLSSPITQQRSTQVHSASTRPGQETPAHARDVCVVFWFGWCISLPIQQTASEKMALLIQPLFDWTWLLLWPERVGRWYLWPWFYAPWFVHVGVSPHPHVYESEFCLLGFRRVNYKQLSHLDEIQGSASLLTKKIQFSTNNNESDETSTYSGLTVEAHVASGRQILEPVKDLSFRRVGTHRPIALRPHIWSLLVFLHRLAGEPPRPRVRQR